MQTECVCCRLIKWEPFLLANKDDVRDELGSTALNLASHEGHFVCVDFLLKAGAEKDAKDSGGFTALMSASLNGFPDVR